MKELNGRELAGYIKERQAKQVRQLLAKKVQPKLTIFYDNNSPVIATYMRLKSRYGEDIQIEVDIQKINKSNAAKKIQLAAEDSQVHGIIVQLPLAECDEEILQLIPYNKDVDGLRGKNDTATAMAIHWLLSGYDIDLRQPQKLAIVGQGKLVGLPLSRMWRESGYDLMTFDKGDDLMKLKDYDVVVSATGVPGLITNEMLKPKAVVVDAGTASGGGVIKGDLADEVRVREDLIMTPKIGGVGPLTVAMLFEQVLKAAKGLL